MKKTCVSSLSQLTPDESSIYTYPNVSLGLSPLPADHHLSKPICNYGLAVECSRQEGQAYRAASAEMAGSNFRHPICDQTSVLWRIHMSISRSLGAENLERNQQYDLCQRPVWRMDICGLYDSFLSLCVSRAPAGKQYTLKRLSDYSSSSTQRFAKPTAYTRSALRPHGNKQKRWMSLFFGLVGL